MAAPTQTRVNEYFNYDPETGTLTFRERHRSEFSAARYASHLKMVGKPAGSTNSEGYSKVLVDGVCHSAHRVIWLIMTGDWVEYPAFEIDHVNGDRLDNRFLNLRKVTKSDNQRNAGTRVNNTSTVHGVNWKARGEAGGRWVARIWNGPRHVYLGTFKTLHEAQIARKAAERALGYTGADRPGHAVKKIEAERGAA